MTDPLGELRVSDFDYDLPEELIAQRPLDRRDASRMLVLHKESGTVEHRKIADLPAFLRPGDLLVANNSRVIPARLHAERIPSGGRIEFLLLKQEADHVWEALAKPAKRLKPGEQLALLGSSGDRQPDARVEIVEKGSEGLIKIRFLAAEDEHLERFGTVPLPPYIHERVSDDERYQTVYSRIPGSAAAPTAGLHFTPELREALANAGVGWAEVTLHIGLDTFRPVSVERLADHEMHSEWCYVSEETKRLIAATKDAGGRVIALGTTAARTLETLGQAGVLREPGDFSAATKIFITPGYKWRLVDGMVTNFHLPKSTLVMMVSALAGREVILAAYRAAIEERYRFFSFGDAMAIV
jgi:S-adenosylmethionine:tRNA ribosyltransferase-isomerase